MADSSNVILYTTRYITGYATMCCRIQPLLRTPVTIVGVSYNSCDIFSGTQPNLNAGPSLRVRNQMEDVRVDLAPVARQTAVAFWILGLCNNYGYVVMLSAAHDIIKNASGDGVMVGNTTGRQCNQMSTGAVLLADIIPAVLIKIVAPFFPLAIHFRVVLVISLNILGYVLVSQAKTIAVTLGGVVAIAFGSGLGEASILAYLALYKNRSTISCWSSGTGGAGFLGAVSYMLLAYLCPPGERSHPLLIFLVVPAVMAMAFWLLLERPVMAPDSPEGPIMAADNFDDGCEDDVTFIDATQAESSETASIVRDVENELTFYDKVYAAPRVLKYMLPFALVYFFEYFINQGLHELIYFDFPMSHDNQYVSYQLCYQIGVFISRSSIGVFTVHNTWLLAILQGFNVAVFLTEAVYAYVPRIAIIWFLIVWEGLLGGLSYVNTYDRINREVAGAEREFFMSLNCFGDSVGISVAGLIAIPVHNLICSLPIYSLFPNIS